MSTIYKYLPAERASYFQDALLRFTPPGALNDPFECLPALPDDLAQKGLKYLKEQLRIPPRHALGTSREERRKADRSYRKAAEKKIQSLPLDAAELSKRVFANAAENMNSKMGILSLSRRWNSSLMWSHYASSHAGFCIGFHRDHPFFRRSIGMVDDTFIFQSVVYSSERPVIPDTRPDSKDAMRILLTKARDWEYEDEERVITLLAHAKTTITATPFKIALFEVPHEAVSELIIGLRASDELRHSAAEASRRLNVPLYSAKISKSSFDVERQRI